MPKNKKYLNFGEEYNKIYSIKISGVIYINTGYIGGEILTLMPKMEVV